MEQEKVSTDVVSKVTTEEFKKYLDAIAAHLTNPDSEDTENEHWTPRDQGYAYGLTLAKCLKSLKNDHQKAEFQAGMDDGYMLGGMEAHKIN